jgi:uncharacterized OB-fold protein
VTEPSGAYGDATTAPFWDGTRRGELRVQRCQACRRYQFYPRPYCIACSSDGLEWVRAAGTGTVYSMTTVRAELVPGFAPPYTVALVELDEGPRMVSTIVDPAVRIGTRVRVTWQERPDAPPLPVFRIAEPAPSDPGERC